MKYRILKLLDIAGLNVLEPLVRLVYREEPREQFRQIILFILFPALTFGLFVAAWSFIAPRHKTKSGEVPTPSVVVDAFDGIVEFHNREYTKLADFERSGTEKKSELVKVQNRIAELDALVEKVDQEFDELEKKRANLLALKLRPYEKAIEKQTEKYAQDQSTRQKKLLTLAKSIAANDQAKKTEFQNLIRLHLEKTSEESDHLKGLRGQLSEMRDEKWSPLEDARQRKSAIAQEQQFLKKRLVYLTSSNRESRLVDGLRKLKKRQSEFANSEGEELYVLAEQLIRDEERLQKVASSEYAKPPTFFDQVATSIKCVFLGFIIATAIGIPIGVLCGLSRVFMAAVAPLISLFKPVSPIVWLPIVFIIVGGFIDVPEDAWLPPAFLSSAITVALCSLWPTLVNTALGVASIDQDHLNVARVLRLGFWSRLFKIVIPSALPLIFAGLRISLGVGWMVLIAGELLSSSPGLGKFVWDMFNNGSSETFAQMFVVVFVVGLVGLLLDRMMIVFQRAVSFDGAPTAI